MSKIKLKSKTRNKFGKKRVKSLRAERKIPAILYGSEIKKSLPLEISYMEFKKAYDEAGESIIIELLIDDKNKKNVLIKDIQLDPLTSEYNHIDFYQVRMDKEITANVELNYFGVSLAIKDLAGILVKNMDEVEVECLPADLPSEIKVDLSVLKTFDDFIKIKDLEISEKVKITADAEDIVATATPPRSEEELKALDEEVEEKVDEVEGVKKEEEAKGEEGEATEQEAEAKPEKKEEKKEESGKKEKPQVEKKGKE